MSFSSTIKEELSKMNNLSNKQSVMAEGIGYLLTNHISIFNNKIRYATENEYNINRLNKILTNLEIDYNIELQGKLYVITFKKQKIDILEYIENGIKIKENALENIQKKDLETFVKSLVRGTFLGGGSLNNPNHQYHLEIIFSTIENAQFIKENLAKYGVQSKLLQRKKSYSIYIKEAEEISKFLAFIGAGKSVLNFEEIRVVRETRNNINRLVNCETANLNKTINASVEQIEAIKYLKKKGRLKELSNNLQEIAELRIKNPEASLIELGQMLEQPIGKSGVNHRLKKITELAEELKQEN